MIFHGRLRTKQGGENVDSFRRLKLCTVKENVASERASSAGGRGSVSYEVFGLQAHQLKILYSAQGINVANVTGFQLDLEGLKSFSCRKSIIFLHFYVSSFLRKLLALLKVLANFFHFHRFS